MAQKDEFEKYQRKPSSIFAQETASPQSENLTDISGMGGNDEFSKYGRGAPQEDGIRWWEVASDVAHTPLDLMSSLYQAVTNAPETLPGAFKELTTGLDQPSGRKLKNLAAGLGKHSDIINQAPANARDYMIRKGAPEDFMSWLQRPDKQNWQEAMGLGEVQPGDIGMQGLGTAGGAMALSGGSPMGAAISGGLYEAGENRNPLTPLAGMAFANLINRGYQGLQSVRGSTLAPQVAEANRIAQQTNRANYTNFNQQTQAAGVNNHYRPPTNLGRIDRTSNQTRILRDVPDGYTESFRNYVANGQRFEDALQAVTDLRGYGHNIRRLGTHATPEQLKNMRASFQAADRLERNTNRAFDASGHPALREQLQIIKDYHANEVLPLRAQRESFDLYGRNRISHEDLIKDLMGNREFMHMQSDRFPGFQNRHLGKTLMKGLALTGGIGAGAKTAWDIFGGHE